ncbi:MAG: signal peptidase II [Bdellovibrionales bacterium]|nr:signal peptidase II [Bdellovibrionales bacterium]
MRSKLDKWIYLVPTFITVLIIDLGTKFWVSKSFRLGDSRPILEGFFHLTLVHNKGAAFGMGNTMSKPFFVTVSFAALAYLVFLYYKLDDDHKYSIWGVGLIMAGALGNLIDRIRLGYVVDFLDVFIKQYHWPAFNVADAAITVGAVLFGIDLIWKNKEHAKS